jgi:hypothetical protein
MDSKSAEELSMNRGDDMYGEVRTYINSLLQGDVPGNSGPDETGVLSEWEGPLCRHSKPYSFSAYYIWRDHEHNVPDQFETAYSDRMLSWDWDKYETAMQASHGNRRQYGHREPAKCEEFLQLYFDDPTIRLVAIIEDCNVSNGYPVTVFRWRKVQADASE